MGATEEAAAKRGSIIKKEEGQSEEEEGGGGHRGVSDDAVRDLMHRLSKHGVGPLPTHSRKSNGIGSLYMKTI